MEVWKGKVSYIVLVVSIFLLMSSSVAGSNQSEISYEKGNSDNNIINHRNQRIEPIPSNFIHRPIVEFFTGLSCPACMGGPHQDMEKLWDETYKNPEQPFNYIVFHELNGGGVDDLATDESKERMQYYQPGVAGTPDAEFDGGYIKLGGLSANSISYQSASKAVEDCKSRYNREFNPLRPLQSIRNNFKFVKLFVDQVFTGEGFAVSVEVQYLGMDAIMATQNLRGSLYVFMIEDNVEAYSKVEEKVVNNRNVFRGYAINNQQITLSEDETYNTIVEWKIPDAKIPIKPGDITAVAAVFDLDDTSSQNGNTGNDAQVPRCIQSASPKSSAYDRGNELPTVMDINVKYNGKINIEAEFIDEDGISKAFVLYNFNSSNSTSWSYEEMTITGEEVCDDSGVCFAYGDSTSTASIPTGKGKTIYFMFLVYDGAGMEAGGLGAQGRSEIYNYTSAGAGGENTGIGSLSIGAIGGLLGICIIIFVILMVMKNKKKKEPENNKK